MRQNKMLRYLLILTAFISCSSNAISQKMTALEKITPYSITFSVSDLQGMTEWYSNVLGFKILDKKDYPQFKTSLVFLQLNGYRVELIKDGNAKDKLPKRLDPPAQTSIIGQSQFCFYSDNIDQIEKELIDKKVKIVWKFQNEELNVKFIFIRDPEDNLIQFLQRLK